MFRSLAAVSIILMWWLDEPFLHMFHVVDTMKLKGAWCMDRRSHWFFPFRTCGAIFWSWGMGSHSHHTPWQFGKKFHTDCNVLPTIIRLQSTLQCWITPLYNESYLYDDSFLLGTTVWWIVLSPEEICLSLLVEERAWL